MKEIIREYVDRMGVFGLEKYLIGCINEMAKNEELTDREKLENIKESIEEYGKITGCTIKESEIKKMFDEVDPETKLILNKEYQLDMIFIGTVYKIATNKNLKNADRTEDIKKLIADHKEAVRQAKKEREKDPEFKRMVNVINDILENADDIEIVRTPYRQNGNSYLN